MRWNGYGSSATTRLKDLHEGVERAGSEQGALERPAGFAGEKHPLDAKGEVGERCLVWWRVGIVCKCTCDG